MKSLSKQDEKFLNEMETDIENKYGFRSYVEENINNLKRKTDFIIVCIIAICFFIVALFFSIITYINMVVK